MYLSRLFVQNYRSIKELDLRFRKGKTVIVGKNNAGKSNIIRAIDLVLGEASPTFNKSENITSDDFFAWKQDPPGGGVPVVHVADRLLIWCELQREDGEPLNYEAMYKCYGFFVYAEGRVPARIDAERLPEHFEDIFARNEDSAERVYVNPKLKNQGSLEQTFENKSCFAFALLAERLDNGTVCKEIRFLYREDRQSDWFLAFKAPIRTELLQSAILNSFRDPQNQLRLNNWTWYGKLMKHLTKAHERSAPLAAAIRMVEDASQIIFEDVRQKVESTTLRVAFPGTDLHFQFNADSRDELYKNCLIYIDDGFKSPLSEKGAGIQSATIIGLFNYYTRHVNTTTSGLLCVEEPEIYLHPHARRVISDRLDEFLDGARNQVILTTHSVEFIRTTGSSLDVILVSKDDEGTTAHVVDVGEYKGILTDNNQNELFFAEAVIACEGFDEYVIRAVADDLFPRKLDEKNVSVIAVSGKDRLTQLTKLVTKLGIRCYLVADFDFLLRDDKPEREQYNAKAHPSVVHLPRGFFMQPCILGETAQHAVDGLKALRTKIKTDSPQQFYTAKQVSELPNAEEVQRCLQELRRRGVCILPGEIEHLSKDPHFLAPSDKKLSLARLADLQERLSAGVKASALFETVELREFLAHVLEAE